jgi:hypothetical protein
MHRTWTVVTGMLAIGVVAPAHAQSLADRIAQAPADATVVFEYEARPGVCGDGRNIINVGEDANYVDLDDGSRAVVGRNGRYTMRGRSCEFGPVRIEMERDGRSITTLHARVGRPDPIAGATDLGTVSPAAAAAFLLGTVARTAPGKAGEHAVFAATLGQGVDPWPEMLEIARDESVAQRVRKSAVFWVGQAAGERATEGLRGVVDDASTDVEVRESAVFALSQRPDDEAVPALIQIARTSPEPKIRKSAIFWLGQSEDPRALDFFEELLVRG